MIDTVVNQSYSNWELCLVDDCSTNKDIKPTLEKYKKMGEFVKYVSNTKPKEFKRD